MCVCSYESPEVALNCGMMLRECLRHEPLARTVLFSEEFFCFFRYVELSTFDIASDAFASFKVRSQILATGPCLRSSVKHRGSSLSPPRTSSPDTKLCVQIF